MIAKISRTSIFTSLQIAYKYSHLPALRHFNTAISNMASSQDTHNQELISNLKEVLSEIKSISTSSANKARLVAVSKTKPHSDLEAVYSEGQRHFGENYVQELVEKSQKLSDDINWHFIGSLQTNKCKALANIPNLWAIETLTSIKQADSLNEHRSREKLSPINIFIQVNTSREESKSGLTPQSSELLELCKHIKSACPSLQLFGLMTIGSISNSSQAENETNPDFQCLVGCKKFVEEAISDISLELSMGMSMDYKAAIEAGSTNVRVGSTIFGKREPKKTNQ